MGVPGSRSSGFTLVEVMIAIALGLVLSIGIVSLFGTTSHTNKLQNGLARLQENGRFAANTMEQDLRMAGAQFVNNFSGQALPGTVVPVVRARPPTVLAPDLNWPDPPPGAGDTALVKMSSIDAAGYPSVSQATASYSLSPRYFIQGYSCDAPGTCTPTGLPAPPNLPPEGTNKDQRLPGSDVLTIRYQRGNGWPATATGACSSGALVTLTPAAGDEPFNFAAGDLAIITDGVNSNILPVATATPAALTMGTVLGGTSAQCVNPGNRDQRAFNFSKDFVTVTYFVKLVEDPNPDARPNSPTAPKRVVPVLVRRENGSSLTDSELVQGIDELKFLFGVQNPDGTTSFMTAKEIETSVAPCIPAPDGISTEPGCLWRSVRSIEAHLLMNTVDELFGLESSARQYRFMGAMHSTTDTTALPSTLKAGSMLRREFVAFASTRNHNF